MVLTPVNLLFSRSFYLQDIQEAHAGQIVAVFGVECASGPIHPFVYVHMIFYSCVLFSLVV